MTDTPVPGEFAPRAKQAVYDAIALRRDIRSFRPDPVPDETLLRILGAAHRAGSVGFMQPWDFVVVRSPERRARIYDLFRRANDRAARHWRGDRGKKYLALKLQGVLDAPLGICVTCDTRRGGPHVLGRDSIRETDVYSTCLAVQNLWLAARAEGVGVGWVSIVDNDELAAELALPEGVIPVAFLCVGYPVEFPATPMLEATGWRDREELARLVHFDGWGGAGEDDPLRALLGSTQNAPEAVEEDAPPATVAELAARVAPVAGDIAERVRARLDALSKPRGSMGRVEELAVRLATIQGRDFPVAERRAVLVFAGDHGVCEEGVSAYRPGVTARLCYNMVAGGGVVNALARRQGVELRVVDVGVDHDFGGATGLVHAKVARGTRSLARHDAMTRAQAEQALLAGMDAVRLLGPCDVLAVGEVGIGNTTSAAALFALLTGASADDAVGRGTGVGDAALARKADAVRRAAERTRGAGLDALGKLAAAGGYEIAALAGAILGAAARRIPVVLDGFITGVAALAAAEIAPAAGGYLVASHLSAERAHAAVLESLGLAPLLRLDLRLGEGSGALLALPLVESACALLRDVRTFREAGIEEPLDPRGLV
ncbi:MAG TPA: nicotinate-nucleotide--dimethylbenzimidazole phosphoribosyltransferase [Longimicrobium sp.]